MEKDVQEMMRQATLRRHQEEPANQARFQEASRNRLLKILERKLKTSFIGALSRFEDRFGQLWGHGLQDDECSSEQLLWRDTWEQVRTDILNNGNNQLRAVQSELTQYGVTWNRQQTNLLPVAPPRA